MSKFLSLIGLKRRLRLDNCLGDKKSLYTHWSQWSAKASFGITSLLLYMVSAKKKTGVCQVFL